MAGDQNPGHAALGPLARGHHTFRSTLWLAGTLQDGTTPPTLPLTYATSLHCASPDRTSQRFVAGKTSAALGWLSSTNMLKWEGGGGAVAGLYPHLHYLPSLLRHLLPA